MGTGFPFFFCWLLLAVVAFIFVAARPLACNDPLGCARTATRKKIFPIGVGVMTSGADRPVSLEILTWRRAGSKNLTGVGGHALAILPFYSPCLPGEPAQSSIDLAASTPCWSFWGHPAPRMQRFSAAGLPRGKDGNLTHSIGFFLTDANDALSFSPDQTSLVKQTAQRFQVLATRNWL